MSSSLTNPLSNAQWHRVAHVRPRLAGHIRITRLWVRGQRWHVLQDTRNGRSCRLNASAYGVAARLDGQLTLHALWEWLEQRDGAEALVAHPADAGEEPPSQDEILGVVQQLHRQGLLSFDEPPDFGTLSGQASATGHAPTAPHDEGPKDDQRAPNSLLSWRIPLIDPDRMLHKAGRLAQAVFSRVGLLCWSALMIAMLAGMLLHGSALQAHADKWMRTPHYLLLAAIAYPVMKALHEGSHALAVNRFGGAVREAGVTLMMGMPVPYVDASAAHGFARTGHRALVSAAGIMAELAMAALGLWAWRLADGGMWHEMGFVVWFVGCVSTVLFNANPLQRLDGYHVLTDALHLPNLAQRSRQWWFAHVSAWLHGRDAQDSVTAAPPAPGEVPWLAAYAPLAWLYQVALWTGMTWWLGGIHSLLGWALGAVSAWMVLIAPGRRWLAMVWQALLWSGHAQAKVRWRAAMLVGLPLLLCLPWPDRTLVQGVVWAPEEALVRPQTDGIVQALSARDGALVQPGDVLITLHNPKLFAEHERIAAQLAQAEQGAFANLGRDLGKAGQAGDQVQRWQAELQHVDEQIADLQVRAHRAGRLVLPHAADLPGRYLHRGDVLGHVLSDEPPTVRVAVPDRDVATLRSGTQAVSVWMARSHAHPLSGTLLRDSVGATRDLPSAAMSQDMGGEIATDPQDTHHTRTLKPVVTMDVRIDGMEAKADTAEAQALLGQRARVRFDQGWAPLPWQAWHWIRRRAATDFNPQR